VESGLIDKDGDGGEHVCEKLAITGLNLKQDQFVSFWWLGMCSSAKIKAYRSGDEDGENGLYIE
jgi:hypothetical protein